MAEDGAGQGQGLAGRHGGGAHAMAQCVWGDAGQVGLLDERRPQALDSLEMAVAALGREDVVQIRVAVAGGRSAASIAGSVSRICRTIRRKIPGEA